MKKKEKICILVLILITAVVIAIYFITSNNKVKKDINITTTSNPVNTVKEETYTETLADGTLKNTSAKLQETKQIDDMEITGIQLTQSDNMTLLLGTITNNSSVTKGDFVAVIKLLDKNKNTMQTLEVYIKELKPKESTQLSTSGTFNAADAYDFTIEKK